MDVFRDVFPRHQFRAIDANWRNQFYAWLAGRAGRIGPLSRSSAAVRILAGRYIRGRGNR